MNERIRQLAEQATKQVTKPDGHYIVQEWQKVFAELIVQECIELAMNERLRYSSSYDKQADWAKKLMMLHCATSMDNYKILLQEHFGVEE